MHRWWLTDRHPLRDGFGPGSPLARFVETRGSALLLGPPLNTVTLLHYAESLARVPHKRIVRYRCPMLRDGRRQWVEVEECDSGRGILDWAGGDYFAAIIESSIAAGHGRRGRVGAAESHVLEAEPLAEWAVQWMEDEFGRESAGWP